MKITDKTIRKLRSKSIVPSVVFFCISLLLGVIIVGMTTTAIITYIVESRFVEKYSLSVQIAQDFSDELANGSDYKSLIAQLDSVVGKPLSISIRNKDNEVLVSYGKELDTEKDIIAEDEIHVELFPDYDSQSAYERHRDEIVISMGDVVHNFATAFPRGKRFESSFSRLNEMIYSFNYWIHVPMNEAELDFYAEYTQPIYANDCFLILVTAAISGIMLIILLGVYFWNAVSNVFSKRYLLKLLLSDNLTDGKNYLAFSSYATRAISIFKKNSYSIIDFSLLKYQNVCSLYGTKEGNNLLDAMEYSFRQLLKRGEMHARISEGDYILLLKNDDTVSPVERINSLISNLPELIHRNLARNASEITNINSINFNAGIYVLPPATDREAKKLRSKKNIDIDQLHLKSQMARNALNGEPGVKMYNHDMWEKEVWEQKVESKMYEALVKEEFQVYIQPKYHPSTKELSGGEALVRWISPTEGFISPGQFIPIFEKTGFITKLDDYMISHTAALQARWLSEGKKIVPISINVSRAHFTQPDLAEHIRDLVDKYPLPHEYIEIELTESAFFDDKNALLTTVKKLQEYGFEVSMDDFGSGYSSLNSLKDLPLDVLKLDAEFFRGEDKDGRGEIVVSEAIALAKQLNMKIVAEGIEKEEQVKFLASLDCDMIQGYFFDKPMPADEYKTRMK